MEPSSVSSARTVVPRDEHRLTSHGVPHFEGARTVSAPETSPFHHATGQPNLSNYDSVSTSPLVDITPPASPLPPQCPPIYPYLQNVPSLSQSYPQELDYERGVILLSPPSSRSESPFSLAAFSPAMVHRTISNTSGVPSRLEQPVHPQQSSPSALTNTSLTGTSATGETQYHSFSDMQSIPSSASSASGWESDGYDLEGEGLNTTVLPPSHLQGLNINHNGDRDFNVPLISSSLLFPVSPRSPSTPQSHHEQGPFSAEMLYTPGAQDPAYFRPTTPPLPRTSNHSSLSPNPSSCPNSPSSAPCFLRDGDLSDLDMLSDAGSDVSAAVLVSSPPVTRSSNTSPRTTAAGVRTPESVLPPLLNHQTGGGSPVGAEAGYESDSGWSWASGDDENARSPRGRGVVAERIN